VREALEHAALAPRLDRQEALEDEGVGVEPETESSVMAAAGPEPG